MMTNTLKTLSTSTLALFLSVPMSAVAADHADSPAVSQDPSADITDVLAWMSPDAQKLNLVLNVPSSGANARFSDAVQYAFHIERSKSYGEPGTDTLVVCTFSADQNVQCWAGDDEYVTGDAHSTAGIESESQNLKVFTGRRNDPFYFNFEGFTATIDAVKNAAAALNFDADGCPALDETTSNTLVGQLAQTAGGTPGVDSFAGGEVLSIVVQLDKTILRGAGKLVAVWGSTHRTL